MKRFALATALSLYAVPAAFAACMPEQELQSALIDWYQESPVGGASFDQQQLWASDITGTWSLVRMRIDGTACVVSQGTGWIPQSDPFDFLADVQRETQTPSDVLAFLDLLRASEMR